MPQSTKNGETKMADNETPSRTRANSVYHVAEILRLAEDGNLDMTVGAEEFTKMGDAEAECKRLAEKDHDTAWVPVRMGKKLSVRTKTVLAREGAWE